MPGVCAGAKCRKSRDDNATKKTRLPTSPSRLRPPPFHISLQVAATARIPLARGATATLCPSCGAVLGAGDYGAASVVALPARARRRARARAAKKTGPGGPGAPGATATATAPPPVNQAALVIPCSACGKASVRPFFTREVAETALARLREGGGEGEGR